MGLDKFIPNSSKASSQLKVILAIMLVGLASALLIGAVIAASFSITINKPAVDNAYFSTTIPYINASTTANTNCTYSITNSSGTQLGPTTLPPDNSNSHEVANVDISSLVDGGYNISVFCMNATDSSDNDTALRPFNKDATPPTTTDNATSGWVNTDVVVRLTCSDGAGVGCDKVVYCIDPSATSQCDIINNGIVADISSSPVDVTITCSAGSVCKHRVRYYSNDTLGNTESIKESNLIQIDKQPPHIIPDISLNTTPNYQVGNTYYVKNNYTITIGISDGSGSGFSATPCEYTNGTAPITWGTASFDSLHYICSADEIPIGNGVTYYPYFRVSDNVGNTNTSSNLTIVGDSEAPTTTADGNGYTFGDWTNTTVTVSFTCSDAGSGCNSTDYSIDGGVWTEGNSVSISVEGSHTVQFNSTDKLGNVESPNSVSVNIDKGKPTVTLQNPHTDFVTNETTIYLTYKFTDEYSPTANCTTYLFNATNGLLVDDQINDTVLNDTVTTAMFTGLSEGAYVWNVTCTDEAGNFNSSESRTFTVDTTPPGLVVLTPQYNNSRIVDDIVVNVSAFDTNGIYIVEYLNDSWGDWDNMTLYEGDEFNGNYTTDISVWDFSPCGWYNVTIYAEDEAGNWNETNLTIYFDGCSPNTNPISPPDMTYNNTGILDATFSATDDGATEVNENIYCEVLVYNSTGDLVAQVPVTPYTPGTITTQSVDLSMYPDGEYTWRVHCNDKVDVSGNDDTSAPLRYIIDRYPVNITDIDETPDMFACVIPGHNINNQITFVVTAVDIGPAGVAWVKANISEINSSAPLIDLVPAGGNLWTTTIIINDTSNYDFRDFNVTFTARDNAGNDYFFWNGVDPFTTVVLYNMTTPPVNETCEHLTSNTTNLCDELNFADVNFVMEIERNGSATCNNGIELPWGDKFRKVITLNFTSVNFSNPNIGERMSRLREALQPHITPPGEFGDSWTYVNTTLFNELNTPTTITMYGLPFASVPNITGPGNALIVAWVENPPYDVNGMIVPNGNLTFSVGHFSQYTITDSAAPNITVISPVGVTADTTPLVNITVDGTGTTLSRIDVSIDGSTLFSYNSTEIQDNCVDVSTDGDWEIVNCALNASTLDGGNHTLTVVAHDFGGEEPGNVATEQSMFGIDIIAPVVSGVDVVDITNTSAIVKFNTDENATCWLNYGTTTSLGTSTANDTYGNTHSIAINGLSEGTKYYFKISCNDTLNNSGTTNAYDFITAINVTKEFNASSTTTVVVNVTEDGSEEKFVEFEINPTNDTNATIVVTKVEENPAGASLGVIEAGIYFKVNETNLTGNLDWVIIKVYYDPADLPSNIDETTLRLYWYNETSGEWEQLQGGVDTTNHYVWGNSTHFSTFAVGGEEETTSGGTSGGSSGSAPPPVNTTWEGETFETTLTVNDVVQFTLFNENHTITLVELNSTHAVVEVASSPVSVVIAVGETKEVDISGDGVNDISITLSKIEYGEAYFTFKKLTQETTPTPNTLELSKHVVLFLL